MEWVFLATDDGAPSRLDGREPASGGVAAAFSAAFGPRLLRFPKSPAATVMRGSAANAMEAVCDLWLLRRGTAFIGTYASTFSTFAALSYASPILL